MYSKIVLACLLVLGGCATRPVMIINGSPHLGPSELWMHTLVTRGDKGPQVVLRAERSGTVVLYQPAVGGPYTQLVCSAPELHVRVGATYHGKTGYVSFTSVTLPDAAGQVEKWADLPIPVDIPHVQTGDFVMVQAWCKR